MTEQFLNFQPRERGLTGKVLAFFVANPEEELNSVDVAEKWDVRPRSSVFGALDRVVRMGLLARGKAGKWAVYRAGTNLAAWAAQQAPARPVNCGTGHCSCVACVVPKAQRPVVPVGALEIRVTLHVHGAGTPFQRVELAGVEP